MMTACF